MTKNGISKNFALAFTIIFVVVVVTGVALFTYNTANVDDPAVTEPFQVTPNTGDVATGAEIPTVLELTTEDGQTFICEHYVNGSQICVSQDDPDIGGGRDLP